MTVSMTVSTTVSTTMGGSDVKVNTLKVYALPLTYLCDDRRKKGGI
jgi:hypothetical protein